MPVPTNLSDLSTTAASNSPAATDTLATADDYIRALSAILAKVGDGTNALVSPTFTTSILTGSTTFALVNTTATTVNFAGAATTLNVGAGAGATATLSFTTAVNLNSGAINSNQSTVALLATPTTVTAFAGASVALNIGNASAAAAFPGGVVSTKAAYIGDTANAKSTLGLTINQGAADDEILSVKSSDIAHGMTTITETDTFGYLRKVSATSGGLDLIGIGAANFGMVLNGYTTVENTTHTTAGVASVYVNSALKNGTSITGLGATGNLFGVQNQVGGMQFLVSGDGHLYANDVLAAYDEHDDVALVRAFDLAHGNGVIESEFDKFVRYNEKSLVDLGILGDTRANGGLVCITRLQQLHNGAIWQLATQQKDEAEYVRAEIAQLKGKLAQIEHRA